MTPLLSVHVFVAYGLLTASMVSLWAAPLAKWQIKPTIWNVLSLLSLGYAIGAGLLEPVALASLALLALAAYGAGAVAGWLSPFIGRDHANPGFGPDVSYGARLYPRQGHRRGKNQP